MNTTTTTAAGNEGPEVATHPSTDSPGAHRRRRSRPALAGAVAAALLALAACGEDDSPEAASAPTTEQAPSSTSPTTAEADAPGAPDDDTGGTTIAPDEPLTRSGLGPIRAGMTVAEAEAASGLDLAVNEASWAGFGNQCGVFTVEGSDALFVARTPGLVPSDDPGTAVIEAAGRSQGGATTEDGVGVGATRDEVVAAYGEPTETEDMFGNPDWEILLFTEGAFGYAFRMDGDTVIELRSGLVTGFGDFEPCA